MLFIFADPDDYSGLKDYDVSFYSGNTIRCGDVAIKSDEVLEMDEVFTISFSYLDSKARIVGPTNVPVTISKLYPWNISLILKTLSLPNFGIRHLVTHNFIFPEPATIYLATICRMIANKVMNLISHISLPSK